MLNFLNNNENEAWDDIHGWLLPEAAEELYRLAGASDPQYQMVEIGSFAGKSAACLGRAILDSQSCMDLGRKLHAIDIQFQPQYDANLSGLGVLGLVNKIQATSLQAADTWSLPISFIYIDGNHGQGHAYADFFVWDMFIVPGGYMALDDTAGFHPGCLNAVLAATSTGTYEKISDLGGVTFLRKVKPSINNINYFPMSHETQVSQIAQVCAWTGALDPSLSIPVRERSIQVLSGSEKSDLLTVMQHKLLWIRAYSTPSEQINATTLYLQAVIDMHNRIYEKTLPTLRKLAEGDKALQLVNYAIRIREMALLRLGQLYDITGKRQLAIQHYELLENESALPELVSLARHGMQVKFSIPEKAPGILLREYVTQSPLSAYRTY